MAKPITEIRSEKEEDAVQSLTSSELLENLSMHSAHLKEFISFLETISESGLLSLAAGLVKNYRYIIEQVAGEVSKEKNRRVIVNALSIYSLLASIDPEKVTGFVNNLTESLNSADEYRKERNIGVITLLNELKDRDLNAGIRVLLNIMRGFTSQKKD